MDILEKFLDPNFPAREKCYSKFNKIECSEEDYNHEQNVWREFVIETLLDYHDMFQDFISAFSLEQYELDQAHIYAGPGLSFNACLKKTNAKVELFTNIESFSVF